MRVEFFWLGSNLGGGQDIDFGSAANEKFVFEEWMLYV